MSDIIYAVLGGLVLILGALFGLQKGKTKKETKEKEEAQQEVQRLTVVTAVQAQANEVKDELAGKQKDLAQKKEEVEKEIEEIPQEETHELSPELKKLAAAQYDRTHSRYNGVLDDTD